MALTQRAQIESQANIRLGAALFNGDHSHLGDEVRRLENAGLDFIHFDIFDGYFVPDIGFSPRTIAALRSITKLPFEVHMGVNEPLRFAPVLVDAGVDLIIVHIESMRMIYETLFSIRELGVRVGIAATLGTPINALEPIIKEIDTILLLSRITGEGNKGASYNSQVLPRLKTIHDYAIQNGSKMDLQVAGGVNRGNVVELVQAGASSLALGAGLYRMPNMKEEVDMVRKLLKTSALREENLNPQRKAIYE